MYQDIAPHIYNNDFANPAPSDSDCLLCYEKGAVLGFIAEQNTIVFPTFSEISASAKSGEVTYLFKIDAKKYFLYRGTETLSNESSLSDTLFHSDEALLDSQDFAGSENETSKSTSLFPYKFIPVSTLKEYLPKEAAFAGIVGMHYWDWYSVRQFCGRCGSKLVASTKERMMQCPDCGLMEFPKLFPVAIVGITNGDKALVSQYPHSKPGQYALIAGFSEVGETIEQTVVREIKEEVGLSIKNIRYYKSQPWAFSSSLLFGFFCELDGSDEITLQKEELAWAGWVDRKDLPISDADYSLTSDMMNVLKNYGDSRY